jgi:hypothetical protein
MASQSFRCVWKPFVQVQFRTQYSGRTLSRLRDFGHSMTKEDGFPTVRRRGQPWNLLWNIVWPIEKDLTVQFPSFSNGGVL